MSKTCLILMSCIVAMSWGGPSGASDVNRILSIVDGMEKTWAGVSDYTMQVEKTERLLDGSITHQSVLCKFRSPDQYYLKVLEGKSAGSELIYPKNQEERVAIAHAGGAKGKFAKFLQRTVVFRPLVPTEFSLQDPSIVRGQHQTVLESNPGRTIDLISRNIRTAIERGEGELSIGEECNRDRRCAHRIDVEFAAQNGSIHEVKESETLWTLSKLYDLPMYVIWYNNPDMGEPEDLRPGQSVFIPMYYAARAHIWISSDSGLLTKVEIFDREGELYERYVYSAFQTNVGLTNQAFDVGNPEYGF